MPRWESIDLGEGRIRHQLDGRRSGVRVDVMPADKLTLIVTVQAIDGTDPATVDRAKQRAERLLIEVMRA